MRTTSEPRSPTFERNEWYERLESQIREGKLKLTSLSIPTRLALARYTEAKRAHECLASDELTQNILS
jgi:hypothetical protein